MPHIAVTELAYVGCRQPEQAGPCPVSIVKARGGPFVRPLPVRHDVRNHSPDGFQWGYAGSGPAQLALAICLHALGERQRARAVKVYQAFKFAVLAPLALDEWIMTSEDAVAIIEAIESNDTLILKAMVAAHGPRPIE
jgi:hypothetical protein